VVVVACHLALATLGACHDEAGVRQVPLAVLGAVHVGAAALDLTAVRLDGGVDGHGVGALGLLGRAVALDLAALGVAVEADNGNVREPTDRRRAFVMHHLNRLHFVLFRWECVFQVFPVCFPFVFQVFPRFFPGISQVVVLHAVLIAFNLIANNFLPSFLYHSVFPCCVKVLLFLSADSAI